MQSAQEALSRTKKQTLTLGFPGVGTNSSSGTSLSHHKCEHIDLFPVEKITRVNWLALVDFFHPISKLCPVSREGHRCKEENRSFPAERSGSALFMTELQQIIQKIMGKTHRRTHQLGLQDGFVNGHFKLPSRSCVAWGAWCFHRERGCSKAWISDGAWLVSGYCKGKVEWAPGQRGPDAEDTAEAMSVHLYFMWEGSWKVRKVGL